MSDTLTACYAMRASVNSQHEAGHKRTAGDIVRYRVALDNYEPAPRRETYGYVMHYATPSGDDALYIPVTEDLPLDKLTRAVIIYDDGSRAVAYWGGSYHPAPHDGSAPFLLAYTFPMSEGVRPDNGRPVDMSGWMLGPRTALHFKITPAED